MEPHKRILKETIEAVQSFETPPELDGKLSFYEIKVKIKYKIKGQFKMSIKYRDTCETRAAITSLIRSKEKFCDGTIPRGAKLTGIRVSVDALDIDGKKHYLYGYGR